MPRDPDIGAYAKAARDLSASGLGSPLPLPHGAKYPPPTGWTGADAPRPSGADTEAWIETHGNGNVAVRPAPNVIGIDVDAHSSKPGAETLRAFCQRYGKLPKTWRTTSRNGISGIYWYRVPNGLDTSDLGDMGAGVEIIRAGHRYALVAPSVHPSGAQYRWLGPDGQESPTAPQVADLPELTTAHVEALGRSARPISETPAAPAVEPVTYAKNPEAVARWLAAVDRSDAALLSGVSEWSEGHRDDYGRGWQKVIADLAYRRGGFARGGWSGRDERATLLKLLPERMAASVDAEAVWASQWKRGPIVAEPSDPLFTSDGLSVDATSGEVPLPVQAASSDDEDTFWTARECLSTVRDFARARMASPWATLGAVLARTSTTVPPWVRLPPIVGGDGSLNLFVAIVAPSGGGKGAAEHAAEAAVPLPTVETFSAGSGEGLAHVFAHRDKGEVVRDRDAALITIAEVDTLTALGSRTGSTLLPVLRSAWSGERLGFTYAAREKALPIDAHSYRLCLVLGVQPERAAALLEDSDGGTPQRFVWLSATDPAAPDIAPEVPSAWRVPDQGWPRGAHPVLHLKVPEIARQTIQDARRARLRGEGDALDGHALFCRLKVTAALMILDGRRVMTDEDWALAGTVMAVSDRTRAAVQKTLSHAIARSNETRGRMEGERTIAATEVVEEKTAKRISRRLLLTLAGDGEMARGQLRRSLPLRDRDAFDEAIERLSAAGQVEVIETAHGRRISPTGAHS